MGVSSGGDGKPRLFPLLDEETFHCNGGGARRKGTNSTLNSRRVIQPNLVMQAFPAIGGNAFLFSMAVNVGRDQPCYPCIDETSSRGVHD
jgi:hypothetical protein